MAQTVGYDIYTDSAKRFTRVNPTGYLYNINHPLIAKLWEVYREKQGIHKRYPASDRQRHEFEQHVDSLIENGKIVVKALRW